MSELYIGLMSGTSLDGVDAVLADFAAPRLQVVAAASGPFSAAFRQELLALNSPGNNELHRAALAGNALSLTCARLVQQLLQTCGISSADVRAIGAHGQTVRHQPGMHDGVGYTLQLNQPALLAEQTGIDVVADFRSRDVAAGGQGAPLVPPFHAAYFSAPGTTTGVLNIGGISNLTVLDAATPDHLVGFDCGPGNVLLDSWCQQHTGAAYDADGAWGAQGSVHAGLLEALLQEPFLAQRPPKSTGRDLFNADWLHRQLAGFPALSACDVQATLTELTARSCADCVQSAAARCSRLIVCGGGALNKLLVQRLQHHLPACAVEDSSLHGLPPLQVEATAFAWLARECILRHPASRSSVTGARGARILGAIYPH